MAKGVDIHVLDPNERAIQRLGEKLQLLDKARSGYAQNIPFADSYFDVVIMSEVLEHLDGVTLSTSLREILRVLKHGGYLLATTPFEENLSARTAVCPDCARVFHRMGHVQSFDRHRMQAILHDHAYEVSRIYVSTFINWHRPGPKNFIKSLMRLILARVGQPIADPHIIVFAHKKTDC